MSYCSQASWVSLGYVILLRAELEGAPHELLVEALKLLEAQGKAQ